MEDRGVFGKGGRGFSLERRACIKPRGDSEKLSGLEGRVAS